MGADARLSVYMVGGAVRDRLLGRPVHDHDWVVVGDAARAQEHVGRRSAQGADVADQQVGRWAPGQSFYV